MTRPVIRCFILFSFFGLVLASDAGASAWFGGGKKKEKEALEAAQKAEQARETEEALKDLQKRYKELEIDRNNVLAQTKQLLADRAKLTEFEGKSATLETSVQALMAQKDKLLSENQKIKKELASVVENYDRLKDNFQEVQVREDAERAEIEALRDQLTRRVEATPQYLLVQNEAQAARRDGEILKKTVAQLDAKLKKALEYVRKIQDRDFKFVQQLTQLKKTADSLKDQNGKLLKANRELNQAFEGEPGRIRDLAKENESLVKETAQMHYNMGVLFTETQKFGQAAKEFQRALEIDPNDQRAHYNLGYLYSEQLQNPEGAMTHFRRFLELDPNSKQAEAVKSYLVMHHVYQGKSLEKESGNPF